MEEKIIKEVQRFINIPFNYEEWNEFESKQLDFLLKDFVIDKMERSTYNALWDATLWLDRYFSFAKDKTYVILSEISVLWLFDAHLKMRKRL